MGELVRTALQCNYTLFAYERIRKVPGKDRDEIQAANVVQYLQKNPGQKVVLLCGLHHAIESDLEKYPGVHWMAHIVKKQTGIDPLTIYQDHFTEKFVLPSHPALSNLPISQPSVWVDADGALPALSNQVDIEVIHPLTVYEWGRPTWLMEHNDYQWVDIPRDSIEAYPSIVSAYREDEFDRGVPIDIIELHFPKDPRKLALPPGAYILLFSHEGKQKKVYLNLENSSQFRSE